MKRLRKLLLISSALLVVAGLAGGVVLVSGVMPIKASSRHWPITAWLLDFAKRRSVATHTIGLEAPPLDDAWKILKGAMQYELACRPCHGSPDMPSPDVTQYMTPRPPYLSPRISRWEPAELFYIVKHGIKFTGMPAWPASRRDDEVWAMVAFLRRFPDLDAEDYRELVTGESASQTPTGVARCARCHGLDGGGRGVGAFPRLSSQSWTYLYLALGAYARGERYSGIMGPIAAGLDDQTMRELSAYYSAQLPIGRASSPPIGKANGEAIAARGLPSQQVPACMDCHGPTSAPRNPAYPQLAGQYAEYLMLQLELFAEGRRGGSSYGHIMRNVASKLTSEQIASVAAHYASLPARD